LPNVSRKHINTGWKERGSTYRHPDSHVHARLIRARGGKSTALSTSTCEVEGVTDRVSERVAVLNCAQ